MVVLLYSSIGILHYLAECNAKFQFVPDCETAHMKIKEIVNRVIQ